MAASDSYKRYSTSPKDTTFVTSPFEQRSHRWGSARKRVTWQWVYFKSLCLWWVLYSGVLASAICLTLAMPWIGVTLLLLVFVHLIWLYLPKIILMWRRLIKPSAL